MQNFHLDSEELTDKLTNLDLENEQNKDSFQREGASGDRNCGLMETEVNRMMKLIINKEVFLRELISNASDAMDKILLLSLTDKSILGATEELTIKIKVDKDNKVLHITDTGIGMTKEDLINNLGTIAKSGTSEFLSTLR